RHFEGLAEMQGLLEVPPAGAAGVVPVVVPSQVEARAGPEFEQAKALACPAGDLEEAAQQRSAPPDLVGLAASRQQLANLDSPVDNRLAEGRPRCAGVSVTARRRVSHRQL